MPEVQVGDSTSGEDARLQLKEYSLVVLTAGYTDQRDGTEHGEKWVDTRLRASNAKILESGALEFVDSTGGLIVGVAPGRWKEVNRIN